MKQNRNSMTAVARAYEPIVEALESRHFLSASLGLSSSLMVFNAVKNASASTVQTLTLTDTGDADLTLGAITVVNDPSAATQDAARFTLLNASSAPATLAPGGSFALQLDYSANAIITNSALLDINSSDGTNPLQTVTLRGIGTKGLGGTNQPSLATILQAYNIPTYVGEGPDDANATTDTTYPEPPDPTSQEVALQRLVKAGTGPVTIQVLASFTASGFAKSYVLGTYTPGNPNSLSQLFYTSATENQTTNVHPLGSTTFDPGSSEFGFYFVSNEQVTGRIGYSEDALNTWDTTDPRKFRFFPLENPDGSVVANAYVMTSTEWNAPIGYDFTNIVAIIRNVKAATGAPDGPVLGLQNASAVAGSSTMVFNRIQSPNTSVPGDVVHDTNTLDINNTGNEPLVISSYTLSSAWTLVNPPTFPLTVAAGATTTLTIKFIATSVPSVPYNETSSANYPGGGGTYQGSLVLNSNDPNHPTSTIPLEGWWQYHSENDNEPSLQSIVNLLYGWSTDINPTPVPVLNSPAATPTSNATYYGEETISAYWHEADPSMPVTVTQIAAYHTEGNTGSIGWYNQGSSSISHLYTTASDDGQTIFPYASGTTTPAAGSFTTTGTFGFDLDGYYSDDSKNSFRQAGGHDVRFFPIRDANGNLLPNTYIMTMDYPSSTANFDFQDNVMIVTNIHPAAAPAAPVDLRAASTSATSVSLQWAPVQDTTLLGYNVYRATSVTGTYSLLTTSPINATSYTDTAAPSGATAYYRVTSVDSTADAESLGDIASAAVPAVIVAGSGDPVVSNQAVTTQAGVSTVVTELTTATDASGTISPSTVVISTAAMSGTTTIDPTTGNITYTPNAGFSGTDTFQYTVSDNTGSISLPATVTVTVIAQPVGNPTTANLSVTTAYGTAVTIDDVATATDPTATILPSTVAIIQGPYEGTATIDPTTGKITYTPDAGFSGLDSVMYTIEDGLQAVSLPSTITITVSPSATMLVAADLTATVVSGNSVTVDDVAAAGDNNGVVVPSTVIITQAPQHGVAGIDAATGQITYTSIAGYTGMDALQYTLADNAGTVSAPATITFTVTAKPASPVAATLANTVTVGGSDTVDVVSASTPATVPLIPASVVITRVPASGTATVDPTTGAITYTAAAGFIGSDTLQYTITDTNGVVSAPATLTFNTATTLNNTTIKSLVYYDDSHNKITVTLAGGGTAQVAFNGSGSSTTSKGVLTITGSGLSISNITVTGTTVRSVLNITHPGRSGESVGDISVAGSIATINAPNFTLTGHLAVTGVLRTLNLGSASGATVSAEQIITLTTTGNFDANLNVSNTAATPFALGTVRIAGQIGNDAWTIAGSTGSIVTGSVAENWTASFARVNALNIRAGGFAGTLTGTTINSLSIVGDDTGAITAGSIGSMRIVGRLAGGSLTLTNAAAARLQNLAHLAVTGATVNAQIVSAGNIGTIITSGITGSSIDAGTAAGVSLPTGGAGFDASATISSVQITGRGATFTSTDIAAQTIGALNFGKVLTQNSGTAFGVAAGTISSVNATLDSGGVLHLNRVQLATPATIAAAIAAKNLEVNDFSVTTGL